MNYDFGPMISVAYLILTEDCLQIPDEELKVPAKAVDDASRKPEEKQPV